MKCAVELVTMRLIAEAEYEAEERRKDIKAMEAFQEMKENAIQLCETFIDETMIEKAQNRKDLTMSFKIQVTNDRLDNKIFYLLKKENKSYSDGSASYTADLEKGYAYDVFINYLKEHCFEINDNDNSSYRCYGFGTCYCHEISISVAMPECFE